MAKMSIEFDTKTKDLTCKVDGKVVTNVTGIYIFPSYDDNDTYRCEIGTSVKDDESEIRTHTTLVASESSVSKDGVESKDFPGFASVRVEADNPVIAEIQKYFAK